MVITNWKLLAVLQTGEVQSRWLLNIIAINRVKTILIHGIALLGAQTCNNVSQIHFPQFKDVFVKYSPGKGLFGKIIN